MPEENNIIADQDMTDEMRIQFAIDKFYEFMESFKKTNENVKKIKFMRNNLINMIDTYLKKFQNNLIMQNFYDRLTEAKENATVNGKLNKYLQCMNEIRVIQEFKGIRENIAYKLADDFINQCLETGEDII